MPAAARRLEMRSSPHRLQKRTVAEPQGIFRSVGKTMASDFVPRQLRASGIGWYNTTVGLLQLVASLVAGMLWDRFSHVAVFYYGAIFAAVGTIALALFVPGDRGRHGCNGAPHGRRSY